VFGHKPSLGLVPLTGMYPVAEPGSATSQLLVNGPLARRAEDLIGVLRVLAGPDGEDPLAVETPLGDPADVSLEGMRVLISERAFVTPIHRRLLAARERAAGALAAGGAKLERLRMGDALRAAEYYVTALSDSGAASTAALLAAEGLDPVGLRAMLRRGGPHTRAMRVFLFVERIFGRPPARRARRAIAAGEAYARELADTLGDGVLLHPPLRDIAPRHGRTIGRMWWPHPMLLFNLGRVPVTQVPLGLNRAGLPLGVQVVAGPGRDHVSIRVAQELERVFGGWVPPAR